MGIIKEFKEFAVKGNMLDMAVGIIIGGAFGKIVTSLVQDVLMPPLGVLLGGMDFTSFSLVIKNATATQAAVTLNYGKFIQSSVDFLIVASAIFMLIKAINSLKREEPPKETPKETVLTTQEVLLKDIRDILKAKCQ